MCPILAKVPPLQTLATWVVPEEGTYVNYYYYRLLYLVHKSCRASSRFAGTLRASAGCLQRRALVISGRIIWPARSPNPIAMSILHFSIHPIPSHPKLLNIALLSDCVSFFSVFYPRRPHLRPDLHISSSPLSYLPPFGPLDPRSLIVLPFSTGARDRLRHHHLL